MLLKTYIHSKSQTDVVCWVLGGEGGCAFSNEYGASRRKVSVEYKL